MSEVQFEAATTAYGDSMHAIDPGTRRYPGFHSVRAICGANVSGIGSEFDPDIEHSCRKCSGVVMSKRTAAAARVSLALQTLEDALRAKCDRIRATCDELDEYVRTGGESGIHPKHATNRIRLIANEIASERKEGDQQ